MKWLIVKLKIAIGTITKHLELLRHVPDHFETKTMCKHAVKKLPFHIKHVPDNVCFGIRLNECVIKLL